jgi:hypothetical protein
VGWGPYEGEEIGSGRKVAVKLIRPEYADSPETVERFRREGRLAGTIIHPRCVFVLGADESAGRPYIVMELMPGDNLADLVQRNGPLPPSEAVALILDVIEGLQEMHRCGLVHRDVKPSNCFLDGQGRVKVGDFGLSKSLVAPGSMTQTGAFLGTLLYAAPEQIRGEKVDAQADLYSVAATLYFLLAGRPPFEAEDAASTLASVISDPLKPIRHWRPEVPATLDEIVQRGLARDRNRRWQNLEDFRLALLPFVPGESAVGELSVRTAAYVVDLILLLALEWLVLWGLRKLTHLPGVWVPVLSGLPEWVPGRSAMLASLAGLIAGLLYFVFPEHRWGCTLGKYLFRLRVRTIGLNDRPGLVRSLVRTSLFLLCKVVPPLLLGLLEVLLVRWLTPSLGLIALGVLFFVPALTLSGRFLGLLLIISTMRQRNGFRGLHEVLSGTRVIRLPAQRSRRTVQGHSTVPGLLTIRREVPNSIGGFSVLGALRWNDTTRLLLAEDSVLNRRVWIWLRPGDQPALSACRREVGRTTRPRWLVSGEEKGWQWDALVASEGCSLPDLVQQRGVLSWAETLFLLEQLTDELVTACADGTLPAELSLDQIWVQNTGRVQLLDLPQREEPTCPLIALADTQQRALQLVREMVRLSLEGQMPPTAAVQPLCAPLPRYAGQRMARVFGQAPLYSTVDELHADLAAVRDRPAEVTRTRRNTLLLLQGLLLAPGLLWMLLVGPLVLFFWMGASFELALRGRNLKAELDRELPPRGAGLVVSLDPFSRLLAVGLLGEDLEALQLLRPRLEQFERDRQVVLQSTSWFLRPIHDNVLVQFGNLIAESDEEEGATTRSKAQAARELIEEFETSVSSQIPDMEDLLWVLLALLTWPLLWAIWAFLLRGGLSYRLTGIAMVQRNGRPSARWRCAWRALIVWAPVTGLLLASMSLEFYRLSLHFGPPGHTPSSYLAWFSWLTWWLAAGLLLCYLWLAQRSPVRGVQDVLAGTYLVPR